jgi:hypothetical protein
MPFAIPGAPDLRHLLRGQVAAVALAASGICSPAPAFLEDFVDPDDGDLDISNWLIDRKGFLPIPIVITEPAVGYGGGVALMFERLGARDATFYAPGLGSDTRFQSYRGHLFAYWPFARDVVLGGRSMAAA